MAEVKKSVTIDATAEEAFAYVSRPENLPEIWPSLVENQGVEALPGGGHAIRWVYKMAGMQFKGSGKDVEFLPNRRVVTENKGGINSTITWSFEPHESGTKVTFAAEYTVPVPLLGKLAEPFIVRANEREAELLLANLKARLEA